MYKWCNLRKYQYQYLSLKYQYKYQFLSLEYQYQYPSLKYKYQYLNLEYQYKYQYQYLKTVVMYGSSTSTSIQYYNRVFKDIRWSFL